MSDEEKKAIEYWKTHMEILHWNTQLASEHYIKVLLDLVEKQSKEIEELKKKKFILNAETGEIKEIPVSDNYVSKDKIKAKIEEINKEMLNEENSLELFYRKKYCKEVLQSLLEKE